MINQELLQKRITQLCYMRRNMAISSCMTTDGDVALEISIYKGEISNSPPSIRERLDLRTISFPRIEAGKVIRNPVEWLEGELRTAIAQRQLENMERVARRSHSTIDIRPVAEIK